MPLTPPQPAAPELPPATPGPDTGVGLSAKDAAQRLVEDGPNALPGGQQRSLLSIALDTVREPMFLLLLAAGTLYMAFGDLQEGLTLFGFVVITLGLTLYQEGKTERAIEALRDLTSPRALVIRDGAPQRIAGRDVVRGDLLQLSEGDWVPADALLVSADGVQADESLLTGEAVPVSKRAALPPELAANPQPDDLDRLWLSDGTGALAWFRLSDSLRPEAATVVRALQDEGIKVWMLSGDRSATPQQMGAQLGMDHVAGSLLPEQKQQAVRELQSSGAVVVMVGDGVNDAPGLGQAHLSVAMASGTDLAQTTADALLLRDDLRALVTARHQAIATQHIIRQNLTWALAYNLAVLPPAAFGFVPPWLAAIGMSLSSLVVVGNALRLRNVRRPAAPIPAAAALTS